MASQFPSPVTFNDNDPNSGYFKLFLTLDEMTLSWWPFGRKTSTNTVFNERAKMFRMNAIYVIGTVTTDDGVVIEYEYNKQLPEKINPSKCDFELRGHKIILTVCKAEKVPWAQHFDHLITPN